MTYDRNPHIIFVTFCSWNLVIFGSTSVKAYKHWVSCERNSPAYNLARSFKSLHVSLSGSENVPYAWL